MGVHAHGWGLPRHGGKMAYQGNSIKIPLGDYGLLTDPAMDSIPANALIDAKNVTFSNGAVQKAPGTYRWNASALSAGVVAVHDWHPDVVRQRMIAVTSAGDIYIGRDREFGTAVNTGLGALTPNSTFVEGGQETAGNDKKLFLFTNGITAPYVLSGDGSSFAAITTPATDWASSGQPKIGVVHRNRLWAFARQNSYASATDDHEEFVTGALVNPIYPGEGGDILGAFVYKGVLLAFKEGGFLYRLVDTDNSSSNWYWVKLASNFGLSAPNAIAEVLDNLFSGNNTGTITDYAASDKLGDIAAGDLIQIAQFESFVRGNLSKIGLSEQHLYYYSEKKIMLATYRSAYYTYNDTLLAFDFSKLDRVRPSYWLKGSPQCLSGFRNVTNITVPMYGDKDGYVHIMDYEDRLEGPTAYEGAFQIPHVDFSFADQQLGAMEKHFDHLAVHYIPEGTGNLSCDFFVDGRYVDTITFPMTQYKAPELDTLLLDTDRLGQMNSETAVRKLSGSGRTFSARFYNSGSNESFQVTGITVMFRTGGQKAQQVTSGGK